MRRVRSWLWGVALIISAVAGLTWLPTDPGPRPPRVAAAAPPAAVPVGRAERPVSELLAPWIVPAPPPRFTASSPATASPPPVVDRTTLKYVGAVLTENQRRYFFKVAPTGQILSLVPGQDSKGWVLLSVQDQHFEIHGPGGDYEAAR